MIKVIREEVQKGKPFYWYVENGFVNVGDIFKFCDSDYYFMITDTNNSVFSVINFSKNNVSTCFISKISSETVIKLKNYLYAILNGQEFEELKNYYSIEELINSKQLKVGDLLECASMYSIFYVKKVLEKWIELDIIADNDFKYYTIKDCNDKIWRRAEGVKIEISND